MDKLNKCFACGYEVPENATLYEKFQEVPYKRIDSDYIDCMNEVSEMYACPCCGTVKVYFTTGYLDKEEIHESETQDNPQTNKLYLDVLTRN